LALVCGALFESGHGAAGQVLPWVVRFAIAGVVGGALAGGYYRLLDTKTRRPVLRYPPDPIAKGTGPAASPFPAVFVPDEPAPPSRRPTPTDPLLTAGPSPNGHGEGP
jgi:hypothetical protein